MPMKTWFSFCDRFVAFTGRLVDANVVFTAWISMMIWRSASRIACSFFAAKYLPPPALAMLIRRAVWTAFGCAL
jgi:hypothetical protein